MNQGGYYPHNTFQSHGPSPGRQSDNFGSYDATHQGGFQFHGSDSGEVVDMDPVPVQLWYTKPIQTFQRHTPAFLVSLLFAMALIVEMHDLFISKERATCLHPDLPFIGFVTLVTSFAMCNTYWTISNPCSQRDGKSQRRLVKCPLDISSSAISSFQRGSAAPATLIRGRISL